MALFSGCQNWPVPITKQIRRHLGSKKIVPNCPVLCCWIVTCPLPPCPCVVWKYSLRKKNSLLPVSVASNKPGLWTQEVSIENKALPPPASKRWGLSGAQNARWGYFSCCASDLGLIHAALYWSHQPDQHHSLTQEGICSPPLLEGSWPTGSSPLQSSH